MSTAHVLGFPRIGAQRELTFALERYWREGAAAEDTLLDTGRRLRAAHWQAQRAAGLDYVCVGDFAWYDHVLNTLAHLGALPERFGFDAAAPTLAEYFAAARGDTRTGQAAMETARWFDTSYRYVVPEFTSGMRFGAGVSWLFDELDEARALGHRAKAVLIGPLTLLWLGKAHGGLGERLSLLPALLHAYRTLLARLKAAGVEWVQIDEPLFALDLSQAWLDAAPAAYEALAPHAPKLLLATYFGDASAHADLLKALPVAGLHLDLSGDAARADAQLARFAADYPADKVLSCGIVDGRNVWRNDLDRSLARLASVRERFGERLWVGTSCSLLHVPADLGSEPSLDDELKSWLAFAAQKAQETALLREALAAAPGALTGEAVRALEQSRAAAAARRESARIHNPLVARQVEALRAEDARRALPYAQRAELQRARFGLPLLPTTTIGSFPQTAEIRQARADYERGALDNLGYLEAMREQVRHAIGKQLEWGLDVLVHGEAERRDMVEYFAGQLWGCALTRNGWVQTQGAQCAKPTLIYGDVCAPEPMTAGWAAYAQSLTDKPVKGLLTGPVTMLQGAFVRDDQPREITALQIALVLRTEAQALESAGIGMIQLDEPALCEALPLREDERAAYLAWAARAFKVASSGVAPDTQIHTHVCDAAIGEILPSIVALDADVLSIETACSNAALLDALEEIRYPNEIGPGVYDTHSPHVPDTEQVLSLIERALARIPAERLWINPDCGLRGRDWAQAGAALTNMVRAAQRARAHIEALAALV